jgi:hypothetical protein
MRACNRVLPLMAEQETSKPEKNQHFWNCCGGVACPHPSEVVQPA